MNKKRTTLSDVAAEAKCSVSMVSYVLRTGEKGNSTPETRKRIFDAVKKLNYHIDIAAKTLRTGHSQSIGVLFPDLGIADYIYPLMIALEKEFRKHNYFLYYTFFDRLNHSTIAASIAHLESLHVEAIITPGFNQYVAINSRIPLIIWGNERENYDCVFPDKLFLGRDVINFLQNLGHRRIGISGLLTDIRYKAIRETLIEYDERYFYPHSGVSAANGADSIDYFLTLPQMPTAIVYHSDFMAIGALQSAARHHLRVPEDLTIIGFGGHIISEHTTPPLTTYSQNLEANAEHLVEVTLNRLRNPDMPQQKRPVPVTFIPRKSHAKCKSPQPIGKLHQQ